MPNAKIRLSLPQARRVAVRAQGLERSTPHLAGALGRTGFIRSLGGVDVYLAARARVTDFLRQDLDEAVARGLFHVAPTVRGCIYMVPDAAYRASLHLAERLSARRVEREHEKVGLGQDELQQVADAVLTVLAAGPTTTQALRRALPEGTVRSLGDIGKKIGLSSTLPPALRRLEFDHRIERILEDGRLDTERYLWRLKATASSPVPMNDEAAHRLMAETFLTAAAFGDRDAFAAWSGLGKREAQKALESLDTVTLEVEGAGGPQVMRTADADGLVEGLADQDDGEASPVAFLPFEDNLIALRQGPAFFVDPSFHGVTVPVWGRGKPTTLGEVRHGALRSIVADNKLVGFWEFEPEERRVVVGLFDRVTRTTRDRIESEAQAVTTFIDEELGHAKSFSIDTEAQMKKRCAGIRALAGA